MLVIKKPCLVAVRSDLIFIFNIIYIMHLKGKIYNFMWTSYLSCFFVPLVLNSFLYFSTPLFLLFFLFQGHRFWAQALVHWCVHFFCFSSKVSPCWEKEYHLLTSIISYHPLLWPAETQAELLLALLILFCHLAWSDGYEAD